MNDKRIPFLVESISSICQISVEGHKLLEKAEQSKEVQNFLDDVRYVSKLYNYIFLSLFI